MMAFEAGTEAIRIALPPDAADDLADEIGPAACRACESAGAPLRSAIPAASVSAASSTSPSNRFGHGPTSTVAAPRARTAHPARDAT